MLRGIYTGTCWCVWETVWRINLSEVISLHQCPAIIRCKRTFYLLNVYLEPMLLLILGYNVLCNSLMPARYSVTLLNSTMHLHYKNPPNVTSRHCFYCYSVAVVTVRDRTKCVL